MIGPFGHYEIKAKIGKGGMGEVYRAHDTTLDRDVAIKVLPEDVASDPERVARFEREAKSVAALQHPNIVTIHSVEQIEGRTCITMELVSGKTLGELIPPGGLPLERFFDLAIPLAEALRAAHAKAITHRDLKPSNVMVDDEGRLRVLDFGLAKAVAATAAGGDSIPTEDITAQGKILGTVNYMSPEQAEGKAVDHRSDIFSLGVVLYEMATGIRPFTGDTPISTLSAILKETPAPVIQVRAALPRHLSRVINRCLEKNPDKRFQTARDVCNELEGLQKEVESGDIELPPSSGSISRDAVPSPRPGHRGIWLGVAGAVTAVALIALAIFALPRMRTAAPEPLAVKTRPLTGSLGLEGVGSWSPDGGFVAYNHSQTGPMDIFVMPFAGGDSIKLVESPYDDVVPRWSPDNRWIAFASNRDGKTGIYLVPPLGGQVRLLAELGLQPMSGQMYETLGTQPWSPDGRTLLFSRLEEGRLSVWSIDVESGTPTRLTSPKPGERDASASYDFSGERIAFVRSVESTTSSSALVMPAGGGEAKEVVSEEEMYLTPAWAPDGRQMVYDTASGGLWMVDVGTGVKRQLTSSETDHSPVVARDGRILFDKTSHQTDLYLQDLDGENLKRLTSHTLDNFGPRISPDGERIAYMSSRTGNGEIWVIDRATGAERQLTNREAWDSSPHWSPDGRQIAFASDQDGKYRLWVVAADGEPPRLVGDNELANSSLAWAPDGSSIGIVSKDEGADDAALFLVNPKDGTRRKVLDEVASFGWYRDSKHVVYSVDTNSSEYEMRVANIDTGEHAVLMQTPFRELEVAPDGSAVSYCTALSHSNMNLYVLPLAPASSEGGLPRPDGHPRAVTNGQGQWHVHNGGWSPDSKQVIYTRDTDTGDIYLLEGALSGAAARD